MEDIKTGISLAFTLSQDSSLNCFKSGPGVGQKSKALPGIITQHNHFNLVKVEPLHLGYRVKIIPCRTLWDGSQIQVNALPVEAESLPSNA